MCSGIFFPYFISSGFKEILYIDIWSSIDYCAFIFVVILFIPDFQKLVLISMSELGIRISSQ